MQAAVEVDFNLTVARAVSCVCSLKEKKMRSFALYLSCFLALLASACADIGAPTQKPDTSESDKSGFAVITPALTMTAVQDPNDPTATIWQSQDCTPTDDPNCNAEGPGQWTKCGSDTKKCTYYESDSGCTYEMLGGIGSQKTCVYNGCLQDQDCISQAKIEYPSYFPDPDDSKTWLMNPTCLRTEMSLKPDGVSGVCFNAFATCTAGNGVCAKKGKSTCANGACSCSVTADNETNKLPEACNGVDDDCDGLTDEVDAQGCTDFYPDGDKDTFGAKGSSAKCLCGAGKDPEDTNSTFTATAADDCDDKKSAVNTKAAEACDNIDNNCSGQTDEGFSFKDYDDSTKALGEACGVGVCANGSVQCAVDGKSAVCSTGGNATSESCDGKDNDCNGIVDNGLEPKSVYYKDADNDTFGGGSGSLQCGAFNGYVVKVDGDCNDGNDSVYPGATEKCNGVDDDCDAQMDEGYTAKDYDGSTKKLGEACGVGVCANGKVECLNNGSAAVCSSSALADTETCDEKDNDCDGLVDEEVQTPYYKDMDGDTYGDATKSVMMCALPSGYSKNDKDCDDTNKSSYLNATELCDGADNDCDGDTDEGCDDDMDGFCDSAMPFLSTAACKEGDCNDAEGNVKPDAADTCDSVDNNCDGKTDQKSDGNGGMISSCNQCLNVIQVPCGQKYTVVWPSSPAASLIDTYQCSSGPALKTKLTAAEVVLAPKPQSGMTKFSLQIITAGTGTVAALLHGSCSANPSTTSVTYYDPTLAAAGKPTGTCAKMGTSSISGGVIGSDNVVLDAVTTKSVEVMFVCQ
jgi:hypothetical protein